MNVKSMAKMALQDEKILSELLEGIVSKEDAIRYNSHKVLLRISEEHPELLYPRWKLFEDLLDSDNNYHKFRIRRRNRSEDRIKVYRTIIPCGILPGKTLSRKTRSHGRVIGKLKIRGKGKRLRFSNYRCGRGT